MIVNCFQNVTLVSFRNCIISSEFILDQFLGSDFM